MNFKVCHKGELVKITARDMHDYNDMWVGFISEVIKAPTKHNYGWNFTLLYGNASRNEISEMNFYDPTIICDTTNYEYRVYKLMKRLPDLKGTNIKPIQSKRKYAINPAVAIKIGYSFYNLYDDGIYAFDGHGNPAKIYDIQTNAWCAGIPDGDHLRLSLIKDRHEELAEAERVKTQKQMEYLKMDWKKTGTFVLDQWQEKAAAAKLKGDSVHELYAKQLFKEEAAMDPILLL